MSAFPSGAPIIFHEHIFKHLLPANNTIKMSTPRFTILLALSTLLLHLLTSILLGSHFTSSPQLQVIGTIFSAYLHVANILLLFGIIAAIREHTLSVKIFSWFLFIDVIVSASLRFLFYSFTIAPPESLCSTEPDPSPFLDYSSISPLTMQMDHLRFSTQIHQPKSPELHSSDSISRWANLSSSWTPSGCNRIVILLEITLFALLVLLTVGQFLGALRVREYTDFMCRHELEGNKLLALDDEECGSKRELFL